MRVLVIGDLILDRFVYGDVQRISPEAASPILRSVRSTSMPGGAGNVAHGIVALGGEAILIAVVGHDKDGHAVHYELVQKLVAPKLIFDELRPTTVKTRYVSIEHSSHLLRVDQEVTTPISTSVEDTILHDVARLTNWPYRVGCIVLSDYAKGVLTPRVIRGVITEARGDPVIVDPKQSDLSVYRGATIITPNLKELGLSRDVSDDDIKRRVDALRAMFEKVLVTCGERGMILFDGGRVTHIPARAVRVRDVSGAGDTVVAALATGIVQGMKLEDAARRANDAAALAVSKYGTAVVTIAELAAPSGKIVPAVDWTLLDQRVAEWQINGQRIGFTNGCFDLIHPGHIKLLQAARAACDKLIVGINSDESVRRLKGDTRPIQSERARAEVLAAMDAVDLVVTFADPTPLRLIERAMPDVLVKGADYREVGAVGSDIAKRTIYVDILPGHSTTRLIEGTL